MVIWQLWKLQSPSTWGCGLKPKISLPVFLSLCHPLREGVDWNLPLRPYVLNLSCHPLREGVDWNQLNHNFKEPFSSHPLREGVDWNKGINEQLKAYDVTLYVRVWIETIPSATFWKHVVSPSTWGCGLKLGCFAEERATGRSPSTWGCGLKLPLPMGYCIDDTASPSTWGCGLKLWHLLCRMEYYRVTLYVRVWIET